MRNTPTEAISTETKRAAIFLLLFVLVVILLISLYRVLALPTPEAIVAWAMVQIRMHGYWIVLGAALIEGMLVLGWYLPGSLVLAFGMIAAREGQLNGVLVMAIIIGAFYFTSLVNYALGWFGWYRIALGLGLGPALCGARLRVERSGASALWISYCHPNLGSVTATSCGVLRIPLKVFAMNSFCALVIWNTILGSVVYFLGRVVLQLLQVWIAAGVIALWFVGKLIWSYRRDRKVNANV